MIVVEAGRIEARSGGKGPAAGGVAGAAVKDKGTLVEDAGRGGGSDVGSTCKRSRSEIDFKRASESVLDPIEQDDELIVIAPGVGETNQRSPNRRVDFGRRRMRLGAGYVDLEIALRLNTNGALPTAAWVGWLQEVIESLAWTRVVG